MKTSAVDLYLSEGCGRCSRYRTTECSTQFWQEDLTVLRSLCLNAGLKEELKWNHPCYTVNGKNVVLLGAFREYCLMTFFKGSIMSDPLQILEFQGENSRIAKSARIREVGQATVLKATLSAYLEEAIELERSGKQVEKTDVRDYPIPEELASAFKELPELREAFHRLTPGRQRYYLIQFSQPKQSKTREARIQKSIDNIMAGKGYGEI